MKQQEITELEDSNIGKSWCCNSKSNMSVINRNISVFYLGKKNITHSSKTVCGAKLNPIYVSHIGKAAHGSK